MYAPHLARNHHFVQAFEFKLNYGSPYQSRVDKVEVIFNVNTPEHIDVILEIDRHEKGLKGFFAEALNMDERKIYIQATAADLRQPADYWARALSDAINMGLR